MADYVGRTLGPYKLEAALGKGGMATVYRAFQASVKRYVAIKVMAPEIADQAGFVERFEREAEVIASLEHPHILPVIDYGNADGIHYLVMRYIEGGSLEDRMRRVPLSLGESARMLTQMASALDYAHKRGVIHRDLKPNNVLMDSSENLYLTDFGIARLTQSEQKLTATGSVMGTPAYMSPEQGIGRPVDARSDIYTLGVVLYEMVLNRLPFAGDTPAALIFQHVYEKPIPPEQVKPDLSRSIVSVLNRAMAKNPDERYQSAGDLAEAFSDSIRGGTGLRPAAGDEIDHTIVGGPMQPIAAGTPVPPVRGVTPAGTPPGTVPPAPRTAAISSPGPGGAAGATPLASEPARKAPLALIAGAIVVLLALIGGGAFLAMSSNNTNQTNTAVVAAVNATSTQTAAAGQTAVSTSQTGTHVAMIALSASPTPTSTPTATATNTPTETPNARDTAVAQQMQTVNAFQTGAANTATVQAAAQLAASATAERKQTATQDALNITATFKALPTNTPTNTPTRRPTATRRPTGTKVAVSTGDKPEDVLAQLQNQGQITSTNGSVVLSKPSMEISAEKAGFNYWDRIDTEVVVADFVMAADVTWDAPDTGNECGFIFRYTEPADDANSRTFYYVSITRDGKYRAYGRDKDGYRSDPIVEQKNSAIQTDDGATNRILLIGQGSDFKLLVNGKVVGTFSDKDYAEGNIGVMAGRGSDSSSLTCKFANIWVYKLEAAPPLDEALNSDNPDTVIAGLAGAGLVPKTARIAIQEPSNEVSIKANEAPTSSEQSLFRISVPVSRTKFTNFVLSTDLTSKGNKSTKATYCGIYFYANDYNESSVPDDLYAFFYDRQQGYYLYVRKGAEWASKSVLDGKSDSIKSSVGETNRVTVVSYNGKITVFINGAKLFESDDQTLTNGLIGLYVEKFKGSSVETCASSNTTVWRIS
jgi:tRNA A-37 threonylcarbamoyl transferase component Bud32